MTAKEAFRNNLNRLVESGEVSVQKLAEDAGIARSGIYRWLDGSSAPNLEQMEKVAVAAKRTVSDLLKGEAGTTIDERELRQEAFALILGLHGDELALALDRLRKLNRPIGEGSAAKKGKPSAG